MGDLFGGSESTPGQPGQVVDVTPSQFTALRGPVADALRGLITSGGGPAAPQPNVAPITGLEEQLVGATTQQALNPFLQQAQAVLGETLGGQFLSPESNPFLRESIGEATRPLIETFERVTDPSLRAAFTRAGQRIQPGASSPFDVARNQAVQDLLREVGGVSTSLTAQNFARERGLQLGAVDQAGQLGQAQIQQLIQGLQAAALPRLIEDLGVQRGLQEFQNRINTLLQSLGIAGDLSSPRGQTAVFQPIAGQAGQGSDIFGGLGGFLGGAAKVATAVAPFVI